MVKKTLELGRIWEFEPTAGLCIPVVPAELLKEGSYAGCVVAYFFKPNTDFESEAKVVSQSDFLIPPLVLGTAEFTKGVFAESNSPHVCNVPFFSQHVFFCPVTRHFKDGQGRITEEVGWPVGQSGVYSIGGVCGLICRALKIQLDCDAVGMAAIDKTLPVRNLTDTSMNHRRAVMTVAFATAGGDTELELGELQEAAGDLLESKALGIVDGIGSGPDRAELVLIIKRGKYPEAVAAIRTLLSEQGVIDYDIWGYEQK